MGAWIDVPCEFVDAIKPPELTQVVSLFQIRRSIRFHKFSSINPMLLPLARELGIAVIRGRHLFQDALQTLPHRNHSLVVRFRYIPIRSFDPFIAVVSPTSLDQSGRQSAGQISAADLGLQLSSVQMAAVTYTSLQSKFRTGILCQELIGRPI